MAKKKPTGYVTAPIVSIPKKNAARIAGLRRIISFAMKWQAPELWRESYALPALERESFFLALEKQRKSEVHLNTYRGEEHDAAKYHRELGERCAQEAKEYAEQEKEAREKIVKRDAELNELADLVEKYAPKWKRLVPVADNFITQPVDREEYPQWMRTLESETHAAMETHDNDQNGNNSLPESGDVFDLVRYLKKNRANYGTDIACVRAFCSKNKITKKKPENLMRQAYRFKDQWRP